VWVVTERAIVRVDPRSGEVAGDPVRVRSPEGSIAYAAGAVWAGSTELVRVTAPAPGAAAEVERYRVDLAPESLAAGDDELWGTFGTVFRIGLSDGEPGEESHPSGPVVRRDDEVIDEISAEDVAVGHDAVWAAGFARELPGVDFGDGLAALMEVDPDSGEGTGEPVVLGAGGVSVAANDVGVWAATAADSRVTFVQRP
jgi:hypothetical protein